MEYDIDIAVPILRKTPHVLKLLLSGLDEGWVMQNEGGNSWSAYDIIGHLIHGENTDWMPRIKLTVQNNNATYKPFDRFAQFENSKGKTLQQLLDEFEKLREKNLNELKEMGLTENDYDHKAKHPEFGEVTLKQLLATWVVHDLSHIAQTARVIAKQYKDEVGPWKNYIPLIN